MSLAEILLSPEINSLANLRKAIGVANILHESEDIPSAVATLLSMRNKAPYKLLQVRIAAEEGLDQVQRYGADATQSGIRQNVLEHIVRGLSIIHYFNFKQVTIQGFCDEEMSSFWRDVEWIWVLHDLGEYGMKQDIPLGQKKNGDSDDEQQIAKALIGKIDNLALQERSWELFQMYEQRQNLSTGSREWMLCSFVKLIDRLESLIFVCDSGLGAWKINEQPDRTPVWQSHAIDPMMSSLPQFIEYLNHGAQRKLLNLIQDLIINYQQQQLLMQNTYRDQINSLLLKLMSKN